MSGDKHSHSIALLADIGGTHARFVLQREGISSEAQVYACASHASLEAAISHYLNAQGLASVHQAAIAVAGPVIQHQSAMLTNLGWQVSKAGIARACGVSDVNHVWLVNDFEALAYALPHLPVNELCHIAGPQRAVHGNLAANLAVIGPGTGLGAAGLLRDGNISRAIVGEGGHMSACPANEREWRIIEHCRAHGYPHVSWERLLSGTGLPLLHAAICAVDGHKPQPLTAEQISKQALEGGDESCIATIDTFSAMLGGFAADVVLTLGATGGLYLAGGVLPKLGKAFSINKFHTRFTGKGRFGPYLADIGIYLVDSPYPAFAGLASLLNHHELFT